MTQLDHTGFQHQATRGTPQKTAGQIAQIRLMAHQTEAPIGCRQQRFEGSSWFESFVHRKL